MNWIPITQELPEELRDVFVWCKDGEFFKAYRKRNGKFHETDMDGNYREITEVTHWCIPTPPSN